MEEKMTYLLTEITTYVDETKKKEKAIYEYDVFDDAVANFHSKMGSAMKNKAVSTELVYITNSVGGMYDKYNDKFVREIEVLEEE